VHDHRNFDNIKQPLLSDSLPFWFCIQNENKECTDSTLVGLNPITLQVCINCQKLKGYGNKKLTLSFLKDF
jgi:hypothetical protein